MASDIQIKLDMTELYQLVGDNKGISFLYEDLPGIVVTVGFSTDGSEVEPDNEEEDIDTSKLH